MQGELFKADTHWFHFFRSMVDSGDLSRIAGSSLKVYLVIKAHVNYHTGVGFPSVVTIAEKSGVSVAQVKRAISELVGFGYILKSSVGRSSEYRIREAVRILDESGNHTGTASWEYVPSAVEDTRDDIKKVLKEQNAENARIVHIERLQVNFNHVEAGGVALNINGLNDMQAALNQFPDGQLKEQLGRIFLRLSAETEHGETYTQLTGEPDHG
ncbi:helix-turn-helix domain-containing protein [Paraburkholderia sp. B3]|uniref:helix-turn-helix domain-containing protein n=1 Tax=Paraburkholderia sp. B3 TaxID=3134791 RepID=UPI003981EA58